MTKRPLTGELDMSNVGPKQRPPSSTPPRKVALDASLILDPFAKTTPRKTAEARISHVSMSAEDYTALLSDEARANLARKQFARKGGAE